MTNKSELKISKDITNFKLAGFFACCADCSTDCGRKRPSNDLEGYPVEDLSFCCANFNKSGQN